MLKNLGRTEITGSRVVLFVAVYVDSVLICFNEVVLKNELKDKLNRRIWDLRQAIWAAYKRLSCIGH